MSGKITGWSPVLILHQQNVCFGATYLPFLSLVSSFVNGGNTDLGGLLGGLEVCVWNLVDVPFLPLEWLGVFYPYRALNGTVEQGKEFKVFVLLASAPRKTHLLATRLV